MSKKLRADIGCGLTALVNLVSVEAPTAGVAGAGRALEFVKCRSPSQRHPRRYRSFARRKVEILSEFDVHPIHNFSFWDALVIRTAKQAGCAVLLSEDMHDQREIEGLQIVNPFR